MQDKSGTYEKYPVSTVIISNIISLAIYGIGAYIMFWVGVISFTVYIVLIVALELMLYGRSCKDCYYFGKRCAFGKGKIACLLIKKGNPENFSKRQVSWQSIIPDLLVTLIPVITVIVLLIVDFSWILLALLIVMLALVSVGNGYVRGTLACRYCKQRELGCPAERLFNRQKSGQQA